MIDRVPAGPSAGVNDSVPWDPAGGAEPLEDAVGCLGKRHRQAGTRGDAIGQATLVAAAEHLPGDARAGHAAGG